MLRQGNRWTELAPHNRIPFWGILSFFFGKTSLGSLGYFRVGLRPGKERAIIGVTMNVCEYHGVLEKGG